MKTSRTPPMLQRLLFYSLWTPEPDEKRFLAGLPIAMFLIPLLWKQGIHPLGAGLVPATFALWCLAYVIKFKRRLKDRGELNRVITAPSVFLAWLLGIYIYAQW